VVDDPKKADAIVQFTEETRQKEILSLTGTGRVREFQLVYRVGFRVHDGKGGDYIPQNTIALSRDITFSDTEVLAKEAEEQLLFRDMQSDMVQQIMRRLASAKRPVPRVP
jgi:LPS-assembly lipoprotein